MPLRCAVAGLNRGREFARLLSENPHCEVVGVCDPRPEALAGFSGIPGFAEFGEMLDAARPDVVAIITPGPDHGPQSLAALEAGCHVLVETPNVYSLQEAQDVVAAARRKGLKYMLAENYVYMGWCERAAEVVGSGRLGTIIGAMGEYTHDCRAFSVVDESGAFVPFSRLGQPGVKPLWRVTNLPPLAYSSHTLGPLLHLMDDRCISVTGLCGGMGEVGGIPLYPLETAVLQTQKGATINLTNGFMLGHPFGFFLALYGAEGALRISYTDRPRMAVATDADGGKWQETTLQWAERADGRNHLQVMVDDFIESVVKDTPPPFDEARSMDFCLPGVLAHESAMRGGEKLEVPLF
jgi:predicted dehydrogenase